MSHQWPRGQGLSKLLCAYDLLGLQRPRRLLDRARLHPQVLGGHGARRAPHPRQGRRRLLQPRVGVGAGEAAPSVRVRPPGLHRRGGRGIVARREGLHAGPGHHLDSHTLQSVLGVKGSGGGELAGDAGSVIGIHK